MDTDAGDEHVRNGTWLLRSGQLHASMANRITVTHGPVDGSLGQHDGPTDVAGLETTSGGVGGGGSLHIS